MTLSFPTRRSSDLSFKDAVARLADALAATVKAQCKLAQARNRLEAAARRTDTRGWVVARRERTRHLIELGGLVKTAEIGRAACREKVCPPGSYTVGAVTLNKKQNTSVAHQTPPRHNQLSNAMQNPDET